ncbi:hypothetical protein [Ramlibacter sp.]|uniref:hypothetical protein n=1 Tax=Ramlibacter sp. TaxID=1917967 RepID=UPI002D3982C3|nr:hypothetical protein [Ramlibacter sp.]HYD76966.1 hypothetical protein [Ramlibacter sp.]
MQLDYLIFDCTEEETGSCSFDAMASVLPGRLAALVHEVEAVLGWACHTFGAPVPDADTGGWDFELQATSEAGGTLPIVFDLERGRLSLPTASEGRITLTLTLSGSPAFGEAFRDAFPDAA